MLICRKARDIFAGVKGNCGGRKSKLSKVVISIGPAWLKVGEKNRAVIKKLKVCF